MTAPRQILVIGLGNDYRGDDAVGRVVARGLKAIGADNVRVVEESGEGAALIQAWKGADFVIVIDAVHSGGAPGSIHRFDAESQPIPSSFFHYSTHAFSIAVAVELARALIYSPRSAGSSAGDLGDSERSRFSEGRRRCHCRKS